MSAERPGPSFAPSRDFIAIGARWKPSGGDFTRGANNAPALMGNARTYAGSGRPVGVSRPRTKGRVTRRESPRPTRESDPRNRPLPRRTVRRAPRAGKADAADADGRARSENERRRSRGVHGWQPLSRVLRHSWMPSRTTRSAPTTRSIQYVVRLDASARLLLEAVHAHEQRDHGSRSRGALTIAEVLRRIIEEAATRRGVGVKSDANLVSDDTAHVDKADRGMRIEFRRGTGRSAARPSKKTAK